MSYRKRENNRRTIADLYQMQSLSLSSKVRMTQQRVESWVDEYGVDGVYVSFSGGKDSTVLLHLVREIYPDVKAVFVDTGLEYPEIRDFVKTFDNVEWLKPKLTFRQVIEKYGYPFISKDVSECVYGARAYLEKNGGIGKWEFEHIVGPLEDPVIKGFGISRLRRILGMQNCDNSATVEELPDVPRSPYNCQRYRFFLQEGAPPISNRCCSVMKKGPAHSYQSKTGRNPMIATMASESRLRTQAWLNNGCNGFDMKNPTSNPMAFWTEQDVLLYIKENNLPYCSAYGDIVEDYKAEGQVEGQMDLADLGLFEKERTVLKTTGCDRTGCMFCGYGCHLEKSPSRFERMKITHPKQYEYIMRPWDEGGLGYKDVIDWINEHGNLDIKY